MRILILDLDTLRPDHLGCYGYRRNTSPNIDKIADQGIRFNNYYCSDAPCLPSRAALISGRFGIHTGAVGHGGTAADMRLEGQNRGFRDKIESQGLPAVIRSASMKTVSISPFAERHSAWWFYSGFDEMYNPGKRGMESAEDITPTALKWIEQNAKNDNWCLHVNYWDAHTPYRAPADFGNPFADEPLPDWLTDETLKRHQQCVGPHGAREVSMYNNIPDPRFPRHPGEVTDMQSLRRMIDGYDCGIRYMDGHIGQLFEALAAQGVMDDLAIIITADHGENMGELGIYGEHGTADNLTCRIPMIIRWPDAGKGLVDNELHYNLDLLPTLCDLLEREKPDDIDGESYVKVITGGKSSGHEYLVLSQCAHVCQRAVRWGDYIYVRSYHDGYHLFDEEMLFDVTNDPYEQNNIAADNPELCKQAVYYMNKWHDEMMKSMQWQVDPMWTVMREGGPFHCRGHLKDYFEHLSQTDRTWAIKKLKERHPTEL